MKICTANRGDVGAYFIQRRSMHKLQDNRVAGWSKPTPCDDTKNGFVKTEKRIFKFAEK